MLDIIFLGFADTVKQNTEQSEAYASAKIAAKSGGTEKKMKKEFVKLLSALLAVALTVPTLASCSNEGEGDSETESGTLSVTDHLSSGDESESESESESPKESTGETEQKSEKPTQTEAPTEKKTETETESETEKPTETETAAERETESAPSLKFISYDNGTCGVSGIGTLTDAYVIIPEKSPAGEVVMAVEDKAFFENTSIKAVQIPSTVMSIGNLAFGGCTSLVYISVDAQNRAFADVDGILYSKDKTKLILFPYANPTSEIFISVSVTEISDMAFYSTPTLKSIKYGGTLSDWNRIKIGDKNYGLYAASLSFAVTE